MVAVRVWRTGRPEPDGPHDLHGKNPPPNWFKEEPRVAAELYALEHGIPYEHVGDYFLSISVKDNKGQVTRWSVKLFRTIEALVRPTD